jgi:hypothetical protein
VLLVEGVEQSYVDDADPAHLEFEYMQHMALVVDAVFERPTSLRVAHLGGGAFTMPRWFASTRPGSVQSVVELSPEVLTAASAFGLPADCELVVDDALRALPALPPGEADVVIWDLYDGPRAVTTALTLEAVQGMRRLVADRGLLLFNVSDVTPFEVVRPVLAAMRTCCDDLAMLAEPSTLRGRRSGNCVLVGSVGTTLPTRTLVRAGAAAPVRATVVAGEDLGVFVGAAVPATADAPLPLPDSKRGRAFL